MTTATLDNAQDAFALGASVSPAGVDRTGALDRRIEERLGALERLSDGWDGADARPIDRAALVAAAGLLADTTRAGLPEPEVFPVPDGGVQIEWRAGPVELEIEIEPQARAVVFVCDDEQTGQTIDGQLPHDRSRLMLTLSRLNAYA